MLHPSIGHASTRFKPIDEHLREYRLELESLADHLLREPEIGADNRPGMLVKVMKTLAVSPGVGTLRLWLHRTASTEARRLGLRGSGVTDSYLDSVAAGDFDRHRSPPYDLVRGVEVRIGLLEALAALPDNYRCAVLLKDGAGLAVGEVARVMGTSPSSARSVLYRARQAMRGRPGP
jgi:RNA polymerase sigma-70 factor (ECF subfamily)